MRVRPLAVGRSPMGMAAFVARFTKFGARRSRQMKARLLVMSYGLAMIAFVFSVVAGIMS